MRENIAEVSCRRVKDRVECIDTRRAVIGSEVKLNRCALISLAAATPVETLSNNVTRCLI
jgi:hypothetical protein